jgi:hypothetical protein
VPIQRGKKRRRPRRHPTRDDGAETISAIATEGKSKPKPKIMRRGFQAPPAVNLGLGLFMLLAGVIFFATGVGGASGGGRFVLLLLYALMSGFYLARAARQYRAKRQA